jgi:hypothetical protein
MNTSSPSKDRYVTMNQHTWLCANPLCDGFLRVYASEATPLLAKFVKCSQSGATEDPCTTKFSISKWSTGTCVGCKNPIKEVYFKHLLLFIDCKYCFPFTSDSSSA